MASIKEKIKKLLALATSPNENEAQAALLKARELMIANKLSDADFEEKPALQKITVNDVKWTTDSGEIWITNICSVLADSYCCSASWATVKGSRTHTLVITGLGDDARVCVDVIKYAVGFVRNAIKILQRKHRDNDSKTIAKSYADGFVLGLELMFEQQQEEHPEWALAVIKPQEVQEYEKTLGSRSVRTRKTDFDPLAYLRGQNDGSAFNAGKILGCATCQ